MSGRSRLPEGHRPRVEPESWRIRFPLSRDATGSTRKASAGQRRLNRLTIPEGWTRWDIAKAMVQVPELRLESEAQALELMNNVSLVKAISIRRRRTLKGIFPDTYEFAFDTTPLS